MALALTQEQRAKTRYYLGYFNLEQRSIVDMGIPMLVGQQGILENNMRSILDTFSMTLITNLLDEIECSRANIVAAKQRLKASEVANTVKMNAYEIGQLWQEDLKLCLQLAQLLASPLYWHPSGAGVGYPGGVASNYMNGGQGSIRWID